MHLKSLTIKGFKSFAKKTVFYFEPGVSVIVGPNGAGKSNIADAVLWVLGEQSPSSLRGSRMEDVIFSGSERSKPVNFCEVSLSLDNLNGDFPFAFPEITISRNVVRGGESEYRINGQPCRLTDVQELLSTMGAGRSLNAVISQGQLERILSCSPYERRTYIEDAAGLLKFKQRRERAIRKMERMESELVRVEDVRREVRRQLIPLRKQSEKLELYQSLSKQIASANLELDVLTLLDLKEKWGSYEQEVGALTERLKELDGELERKKGKLEEIEQEERSSRIRHAQLTDSLYRLVSLHEELKATLVLWGEEKYLDLARVNLPSPKTSTRLSRRLRELEERREELRGRLSKTCSELGEVSRMERELKEKLEKLQHEIIETKAFLDASGGTVQPLLEAISERKKEIEQRSSELSGAIESALLASEKKREEFSSTLEEIKQLRTKRAELEAVCEGLLEEKSRLLASRAEIACRLHLLSSLETRRWTFLNTVSELLESDFGKGKLGEPLIHELDIDSSCEKAVMDFLGPWAFALPVKDDETVIAAIRYLKERGAGKALFFREGEGDDTEFASAGSSLPMPAGTVPALEAVRAPARFMDALKGLLADTYIVESLEEAFNLASRYPRFTFLTPDGDVISGGTFLRGGSPTLDPLLLEACQRRREEMESSIEEIQVGLDEICLRIEAAKSDTKRMDDRLESAEEALSRCSGESEGWQREHSSLSGKAEVLSQELAYLEGLDLPLAPLEREDLEGKLARLSGEEAETKKELDRVKAERVPLSREEGKLREDISATEREIAIITERQRKMAHLLRTPEGNLADNGWFSCGADIKKIADLHERLVSLAEKAREELREELSSESGEGGETEGSIDRLKVEILRLEEEEKTLEDKIHSRELSSAEVKVKLEQVVEKITKTHGVSLEFALKAHNHSVERDELERRIEELSGKLEQIGPVNPEAMSQLSELEERHDFFKSQLEDLKEGKSELQKVIREVDNQIKERFLAVFEETNAYFREMFSFLFPNGKAELKLSEPDDVLNSGVEIFAQPEGKKLRKLSLLSGGETSLTALALFFALFKVRPSPFYFLDEVEAALDDVNLERFLELVKDFREESQLIMITHQRKSMEIGDALYGVTMREDGISRAVSQRMAV